jgi:uncharacterized membrane protein (UPF0127 family)
MGRSVAAGLIGVLVWLAAAFSAAAQCRDGVAELRWDGGSARFAVEVAATPEARSRGLMFRESLPASAGMLFLFERPGRVSFWMRNTLIPLDMIFLDRTGTVTRVHADARPHDETPIDGGAGVLAVLEINGGLAARLGIRPGAHLRHPGMPQDVAAWPC